MDVAVAKSRLPESKRSRKLSVGLAVSTKAFVIADWWSHESVLSMLLCRLHCFTH